MNTILDRILTQLGDKELIEKLLALPKSDFNSLLIKIFQSQTQNTTPIEMLKAFQTNRFSVPSELDPVAYHRLETEFLSLAQSINIKTLLFDYPYTEPFAHLISLQNIISFTRFDVNTKLLIGNCPCRVRY